MFLWCSDLASFADWCGTSAGNIQEVLGAASHLQLLPVVAACASYLHSQLDTDNCIDILTIAETYSLPELTRTVYCYIGQNLDRLVHLPEFQNMSAGQLQQFLRNEYPISCREVDVLSAILNWFNHDPQTRMESAKDILNCIHFENIRRNEFQHLKKSANFKDARSHAPFLSNMLSGFMFGCRRSRIARHGSAAEDASCLINPRGFKKAIVNIGGFHCTRGLINDVTYFHPHSGQWKRLTSIPHVEQCDFGVAVIDNELFVVGGCFNQSLQEHVHPFGFKYSPRADKWSTILPMLQERCRFFLGAVGRKLYAVGGTTEQDGFGSGSCESYNPETDSWHPVAGLDSSRTQHAGAVAGHCIYVTGGLDASDAVLSTLLCYNVDEDQWTTKATMLAPRADHAMVAHGERLYVAGGWHEDPTTADRVITETIDCYDQRTDQWVALAAVPTPRYHCSLTVLEDTLFLIGGFGEGHFNRATKKIETFDMRSERWSQHEDYPVELWEHSSCVLYVPTCRNDKFVSRGEDGSRRSRNTTVDPYAQ